MIEADGIEAVSISYTAGVAAAALAGLYPSEYILCLLIPAGVLAVNCTFHRQGSPLRVHLLLFLLGAFSYSCSNIPLGHAPVLGRELAWTKLQIRNIPFSSIETNGILLALLTGDRSLLGSSTVKAFRDSGGSHILALSGLHLGIIYGILRFLALPFGKSATAFRIRSVAIILSCTFYTILTGAGPSLVRALIFIILREISENLRHRKRNSGKIFCTALLAQLCISPLQIKSLSFQLSYLAMTGITFVYPVLASWFPKTGDSGVRRFNVAQYIWNAAALSTSCQIFTGPLVWWKFGVFPKYFLVTNLIALPLCELLIVGGIGCLVLSAAGTGFHPLIALTELLYRILNHCLSVIAGM